MFILHFLEQQNCLANLDPLEAGRDSSAGGPASLDELASAARVGRSENLMWLNAFFRPLVS